MDAVPPITVKDKILQYFYLDRNGHDFLKVENNYSGDIFRQNVRNSIKILNEDGFLDYDGYHYYTINAKGIRFYEKGGYNALEIKKEDESEIIAKIPQSTIDTNAAVKETSQNQRRANTISLTLAAISTLFIGYSAWKQWTDTNQSELKLLREAVQSQSQAIQRIDTSLKNLNSEIRRITNDTTKRP